MARYTLVCRQCDKIISTPTPTLKHPYDSYHPVKYSLCAMHAQLARVEAKK